MFTRCQLFPLNFGAFGMFFEQKIVQVNGASDVTTPL